MYRKVKMCLFFFDSAITVLENVYIIDECYRIIIVDECGKIS